MKKLFLLLLSALMVFSCLPVFSATPIQENTPAPAAEEAQYISWFTLGMTVAQAKEISPALKTFSRNGKTLSANDIICTGDTVITDNGTYISAVRGDILGQGYADIFAYMALKCHCLDVSPITDPAVLLAADVNEDGIIDMFDCAVIKNIHFGTYSIPLPENAEQVPILLYHHILPDNDKNTEQWRNNDITISTSEYRRHMQMLADGGHYVATVAEVDAYVRGEILLPSGSVVLTFDDGYKSNTSFAAPIMKDFGFKATVFSIMYGWDTAYQPNYDVTSLQRITPTDLALAGGTFEQQCHTYGNHNMLSEQSYSDIYRDLMTSQSVFPCDYFAYPYGNYDSEVINAVKDAGFKAAFTTAHVPAKPGDKVYEIPRITITSPMTDSAYLKLLQSAY